MDQARKEALRRQQDDLRTGIRVNDILPSLHKDARGFLDDVEEDRVKSKEGNVAQVDELLAILLTKENKDFDYFCTIIEKNNATRASNLRKAAGLGLYRSSSSRASLGDSRTLHAVTFSETPVPPVMLVPNAGREHSTGIVQPTGSHAAALRETPVPQGSCSAPGTLASNEGFEDYGTYEGQPSPNKPSPILGHSPGDLEDVDYGQEDTDGPPSSSNVTLRPEVNFPAKAGDHLVQERIWDELKSAVVCIRPNDDLDEEIGTAFVAKTPDGRCILLSALHCFLEDQEEEDVEEVGGVEIEERLARPTSRKKKEKKSEIELQLNDPAELTRRIVDSHEGLLRDRILRYCYWFCYKERGQYVELRGGDFIAEHIRVEYNVKRDIISFPVDIAKIEAELAERGQKIHPIKLDKVKGASDPQGRGKSFWNKRTATAYGFPLGKPLSRSGGRIVEYVPPTGTKTERIGYQVRTEGGSSGGPVFVTFGDDNPIVVAIHCEPGKPEDARNYGTLLWPFLKNKYFQED